MTEKELAEKVWEWFDKEVIHCMVDEDGIPYEAGVSHVSGKLEKILPRPKRKVKKTLRRWVAIYKNPNGHIWTGGTFEYKDSIDSDDEELNFKRVCHLEEIGRKEIEITFEVEE